MTDRHDPDIEELLEGTAVRPARALDPRAITRRAKRRAIRVRALGAVGVLAVVTVAGTWIADLGTAPPSEVVLDGGGAGHGPEEDETAEDSRAERENVAEEHSEEGRAETDGDADDADAEDAEPSGEATGPERPDEPPDQWVGVRESADDLVITRHEGDEAETVARHPHTTSDEEPAPTRATDLLLDEATQTVLLGLCCEPTSGSFLTTLMDGSEGLEPARIQGIRADLSDDGSLFARADTSGILGIQPSFPAVDDQIIHEHAAAADVGVDPAARSRVAALIDAELASMPVHEGDGRRGVRLHEREDPGEWAERWYDLEDQACAMVFLAEDRVGLLRLDGETPEHILDCTGTALDVLDLGTGEIEEAALEFPTALRHLSVDASGHYLIATGADGTVRWATLDGEGGQLADGGYTGADW